jgi:ribosomal protein S18 acetylase RimI-like enzyme
LSTTGRTSAGFTYDEVTWLYVDPARRYRRGIGRALQGVVLRSRAGNEQFFVTSHVLLYSN